MTEHHQRFVIGAAVLTVLLAGVAPVAAIPPVSWQELPVSQAALPPLPPLSTYTVQLVNDDDSAEGSFGIGGVNARQFLWFQQLETPTPTFDLHEIWVLFPQGTGVSVGQAVQLVVFLDPDNDPSNGADLVYSADETVQVADGLTFSIYPIATPVEIRSGGDVLIGVVNRFVSSNVSPLSQPAALDTSSSHSRSWIATWTGDPPDLPSLPPDQSLFLVDGIIPGNWMIRGFGTVSQGPAVPLLDLRGLVILTLLVVAAGATLLLRRL